MIYFVRIVRTYEDGTTETQLSETYPGKQRREALARYDELRKQRPGIETLKDIAPKPGRNERRTAPITGAGPLLPSVNFICNSSAIDNVQ